MTLSVRFIGNNISNVQKSIDGFNRQIAKMVNGEFTDDELKTAKMNLKRSLLEQNDVKQSISINKQ